MSVSATTPHTDIQVSGWIARLPPALRPYALLARLDRPVGTWLLFLPGVWGILLPQDVAATERLRLIVLFGIGGLVPVSYTILLPHRQAINSVSRLLL